MFQDFEGFPRSLYSESFINPEIWDWLELDDDERELLAVYQDNVNQDGDISEARAAFMGKYRSAEDRAAEWLEDTGSLADVPEHLAGYIDFAAYARDMRTGGGVSFARVDGDLWVFDTNR